MESFEGLLRETMLVAALLCIPVLAVAAIVGAAIAVIQAATQVQEQTLTVVPKILAVGAMLALFGSAGMQRCANLFRIAVESLPELVNSR